MARQRAERDVQLERIACVSMAHVIDGTALKVVDVITFDDFTDPGCRKVWQALEGLVAERDGWVGGWEVVAKRVGMSVADWGRFAEGVEWVMSSDLMRSVEKLADLAGYRRARTGLVRGVEKLGAGEPIDDVVAWTIDQLQGVRSVVPERPLPPNGIEIFHRADIKPEYDWLVPGWLEPKDRVMLTGSEGIGKMTLMRQWAVQLAAGIHPWTGEEIQPLRTLQLDLQDGQQRNEREFRKIFRSSGVDPPEIMFAESWKGGCNVIRSTRDRRAVESLIRSCQPHVLLVGPAYLLAKNSARKESETAQGICDFVDMLTNRYDVAIIIEAHSPNAPSTGPRVLRPYGGAEFTAWPDAGVGLVKDGTYGAAIREWRGNRDRDEKVWPDKITQGVEWPWVPKGTSVLSLRPRHVEPRKANSDTPTDEEAEAALGGQQSMDGEY